MTADGSTESERDEQPIVSPARTSGWPPTRNEWIGLVLALVLGTLAVVLIGWLGVLR